MSRNEKTPQCGGPATFTNTLADMQAPTVERGSLAQPIDSMKSRKLSCSDSSIMSAASHLACRRINSQLTRLK